MAKNLTGVEKLKLKLKLKVDSGSGERQSLHTV
jgi:hypothetical protein